MDNPPHNLAATLARLRAAEDAPRIDPRDRYLCSYGETDIAKQIDALFLPPLLPPHDNTQLDAKPIVQPTA